MLWFKKRSDKDVNVSELQEEKDEVFADLPNSGDDINEDELEKENESDVIEEIPDITVKINSLDQLAEFMNSRSPIGMQFMRKENNEAFEIRESHLRIARVWGSVSMSRECSPEEYGKIMLALELLQDSESFYVIPSPSEDQLKDMIDEFCAERYGDDIRRYSKNPKKLISTIKENGDAEEWQVFSREAMYRMAENFCEKNGIEFASEEENDD